MKRLLLVFSTAILLTTLSCTKQEKVVKQYSYFDLEGFFTKEAARLQKSNMQVKKTVRKNNDVESKTLKITNWKDELNLFSTSDINKPAWKNSYRTMQNFRVTTYISTDPNLRTSKIVVGRDKDGAVRHISITNRVSNLLYSSTENLNYFPDSLYEIYKEQKVKVIGDSRYVIRGELGE